MSPNPQPLHLLDPPLPARSAGLGGVCKALEEESTVENVGEGCEGAVGGVRSGGRAGKEGEEREEVEGFGGGWSGEEVTQSGVCYSAQVTKS